MRVALRLSVLWLSALACRAPAQHAAASPPARANAVELTWVIHPATAEAEAGPARIIDLVARIGDATQQVALGEHHGYLHPAEQSLCSPSLKVGGVVSQLKLDTFGPETIVATRVAAGKLEISTHKLDDRVVGEITIPADSTVSEAIVDMHAPALRTAFDCRGGTSSGIPKEPRILPVSPTAKVIDTRDWKSASPGSTLTATWTVDQSHVPPDVDRSKVSVPVTLDLRLGDLSRTVVTTGSGGAVQTNEHLCGEISFYWAGAIVALELKRAEGGKMVLVRKENYPALKNEQLFVFEIPSDVRVVHSVIVTDEAGKRTTATACKSNTL